MEANETIVRRKRLSSSSELCRILKRGLQSLLLRSEYTTTARGDDFESEFALAGFGCIVGLVLVPVLVLLACLRGDFVLALI